MAEDAIRVSRKGFDVFTCADNELLFSSDFPTLKIHMQGSFTVGAGASTVVDHGLGYEPVFWVFSDFTNGAGKLTFDNTLSFGVDKQSLKYDPSRGSGGACNGYYFIFRRDINEAFTAPQYKTLGTKSSIKENYVFAISKEGKDVSSEDYRDFIIHSDTRNMLIHKSGVVEKDGIGTITITHNLNYKPMYFWFLKSEFRPLFTPLLVLPNTDNSWMPVTATPTTITVATNQPNAKYAYIIFKDPLL